MDIQHVHYDQTTNCFKPIAGKQHPPIKQVLTAVPPDQTSSRLYTKGVISPLEAKGTKGSSNTSGIPGFFKGDMSQLNQVIKSVKDTRY